MNRAAKAASASSPQLATSTPRTPPAIARIRFSVRRSCSRRNRVAPRAVRTAISFSRRTSRAMVRLATLAQTITSKKRVVASSTMSVGRAPRVSSSRRDAAVVRKPSLFGYASGYAVCSRSAICARSFCAVASVAPERSLPNTVSPRAVRVCDHRGPLRNGQATLGMNTSLTPGYCGMGASTPTTWWTLSFMVKVLPTTSGSPRYARCQYSYVRTRTGAAPCTSSSATNVLPSSGRTPKASKKFAETTAVETRCASAPPSSVNCIWWYSTTASRARVCSR